MSGDTRESVRGSGRVVVEVEGGITVYPPQRGGEPWRAVFTEKGRRRYREAGTEEKLAVKLAKVTERLQADAPHLERPGADLIAWYLSPDRHPAGRPWSRKHADTRRRLCARFAAPVIAAVPCQDIRVADMQQVVNAAPTAGEGARLRRCLSAMVTAGIAAGYLTSPRLREVHWQAAGRAAPGPLVSIAGESAQFTDAAEIPADADVARLGQALAGARHGDLHELMASTAAYSGLRQGELFALTAGQVAAAARVITVDRQVVEVGGKLFLEAPKGRKRRSTVYPARTPAGYPLAGENRGPRRAGPGRAGRGHQPPRADVPLPPRGVLAVLQLRPPRPGARLPGGRVARRRRYRHLDLDLDLAQPAARILHGRPVLLAPGGHRRVLHGRARQRPRHPRQVRRRHRRHPGPRPHSHQIARSAATKGLGLVRAGRDVPVFRTTYGGTASPVRSKAVEYVVKSGCAARYPQAIPGMTAVCGTAPPTLSGPGCRPPSLRRRRLWPPVGGRPGARAASGGNLHVVAAPCAYRAPWLGTSLSASSAKRLSRIDPLSGYASPLSIAAVSLLLAVRRSSQSIGPRMSSLSSLRSISSRIAPATAWASSIVRLTVTIVPHLPLCGLRLTGSCAMR